MTPCESKLMRLFDNPINKNAHQHSVEYLIGDREIIVYGAGDGFIGLRSFLLNKYSLKPVVILDKKFSEETTYESIPAFHPDRFTPTEEQKKNAVVIIAVGKTQFHEEIIANLESLGMERVVLAPLFYDYHLLAPTQELLRKGVAFFTEQKQKILDAYHLMHDSLSQEIFSLFIESHLCRIPLTIPSEPLEDQYFPEDIAFSRDRSRVINCGAYDGDTVRQLVARHGKLDALACFEPELSNFLKLATYLRKGIPVSDTIAAFPCGVLDENTTLRFEQGNSTISQISSEGSTTITCLRIDDALPGFAPTFINMDVEGVELKALQGAENLIRETQPDLAICVYHSPNDIWEIPLYLEDLDCSYRFYLRNYTGTTSETVLYATKAA